VFVVAVDNCLLDQFLKVFAVIAALAGLPLCHFLSSAYRLQARAYPSGKRWPGTPAGAPHREAAEVQISHGSATMMSIYAAR
jgi:hypothetical protein